MLHELHHAARPPPQCSLLGLTYYSAAHAPHLAPLRMCCILGSRQHSLHIAATSPSPAQPPACCTLSRSAPRHPLTHAYSSAARMAVLHAQAQAKATPPQGQDKGKATAPAFAATASSLCCDRTCEYCDRSRLLPKTVSDQVSRCFLSFLFFFQFR